MFRAKVAVPKTADVFRHVAPERPVRKVLGATHHDDLARYNLMQVGVQRAVELSVLVHVKATHSWPEVHPADLLRSLQSPKAVLQSKIGASFFFMSFVRDAL